MMVFGLTIAAVPPLPVPGPCLQGNGFVHGDETVEPHEERP